MQKNLIPLPGRIYHVIPGFEDHLFAELKKPPTSLFRISASLYHDQEQTPPQIYWQQNCWLEPFRLEFGSINEAASALRSIQRNWAACLHSHFRRGALIESRLPPISARPRPFPWELGATPMGIAPMGVAPMGVAPMGVAPMGAWTLLDEHTMIASAHCSSPFPNGVIEFAEDKEGPPSRAYLKLWEALVRLRCWPEAGERCLDAGASPGGWSWALARLGALVIAVDRAPLEDRIAAMPGVEYLRRDAFALKPQDIGPIDWLFCDVACYPPKLYQWIEQWLSSGMCKNFVCTIKLQGLDLDTPRRFAEIPDSTLTHLYHNKHELTWMYQIKSVRPVRRDFS